MKEFPRLYARNIRGKIKVWDLRVEDSCYITNAGMLNGALTTNYTSCFAKNIGKKNQTTSEEQALIEGEARWKKQFDKGYRPSIEEADSAPKRPNLCQDYKDMGHNMVYPCYAGTKLNGMRVYLQRNEITKMYEGFSRNLKFVEVPEHIQKELQKMDFLPDTIDGEFYVHGMHLQDIISLIKRPRNDDGYIRSEVRKLEYHLFDFPHPTRIAEDRLLLLKIAASKHLTPERVHFVEAHKVPDEKVLLQLRDKYVKEGYEGIVVRAPLGTYDYGAKTRNMMKWKPFQDDEFQIFDFEADKDGLAVAWLYTKDKKPFKASIEGQSHFNSNTEYRGEIMRNKIDYIGKQATVRYQDLTKDGIPSFGTVSAIRDYE